MKEAHASPKDAALKLALEALTNAYWPTESDLMPAHNSKECADAIAAIKEALAQPEQEPVALQDDEIYDAAYSAYCRGENTKELFRIMWNSRLTCSIGWDRDELKSFARNIAALYNTPPQRTWVGLTNEEVEAIAEEFGVNGWIRDFARAIEAELKEENDC